MVDEEQYNSVIKTIEGYIHQASVDSGNILPTDPVPSVVSKEVAVAAVLLCLLDK